jgi:hypothetical protein
MAIGLVPYGDAFALPANKPADPRERASSEKAKTLNFIASNLLFALAIEMSHSTGALPRSLDALAGTSNAGARGIWPQICLTRRRMWIGRVDSAREGGVFVPLFQ